MSNDWSVSISAKSFEKVSLKYKDFISLKANSGLIKIQFMDNSFFPNSNKKVNGWNSTEIYGIDISAKISETSTITFKYLDEGKFLLTTTTKLTGVSGMIYGKDTISYGKTFSLNDLASGQYIIQVHDKNTVTATKYH